MSNGTCFVIQPFQEPYNKRFTDVYAPAVKAAGLEPYRIDQDLTVDHIVEKIQTGIRESVLCLADITLDNANVFYELGAAHAQGKDVVMVCDQTGRASKLPFDVAHRTVLMYKPEAPSDFDKLRALITEKLKAILKQRGDMRQITALPLADLDGLETMELALLVILAESTEAFSFGEILNHMEHAGFTKVATRIALAQLQEMQLAMSMTVESGGYGPSYDGFSVSPAGLLWLRKNKDKIKLRKEASRTSPRGNDEPPF